MRSRTAHCAATGVVAAIALFLAREPLFGSRRQAGDGAKRIPKRKPRKKKQDQDGDSPMTDHSTTTSTSLGEQRGQRAIEAYEDAGAARPTRSPKRR